MTKHQENPADTGGVSAKILLSYFERIERLEAEIKGLNDDKSDLYQEIKGTGFNVKAVKALVAERRKLEKNAADFNELSADIELYRHAIGMGSCQIDLFSDPSA